MKVIPFSWATRIFSYSLKKCWRKFSLLFCLLLSKVFSVKADKLMDKIILLPLLLWALALSCLFLKWLDTVGKHLPNIVEQVWKGKGNTTTTNTRNKPGTTNVSCLESRVRQATLSTRLSVQIFVWRLCQRLLAYHKHILSLLCHCL